MMIGLAVEMFELIGLTEEMGELIGSAEVMIDLSRLTHLFEEWLDCEDDGSREEKVHHLGNHKWRKLEYPTLIMGIDFHQIICND